MSTPEHIHHPTPAQYWKIAVVLAVLTAIEVAIYYIHRDFDLGNFNTVLLIALAALKFVIVIGWYMHLRFENRMLSRFFTAGFILACALYTIILTALGAIALPAVGEMIPPFHPHYDVWALAFALAFGYWYADRRLRPVLAPDAPPATTGQKWQWYGAVVALWLVSGWPIHDIGETSLFTVHMVEHMVIALVIPPLMLRGTPRWLADVTIGHPKIARFIRPLARPVPAFVLFNSTFIIIHWPDLVALMVQGGPPHLLVHAWLFGVSILMWLPVFSPTLAIPRLPPPGQMFYLFAQSLLPTIPASFLTFSTVPLYPVYGDAALAFGLTAVADQTIAGVIMKLGGGLLLWSTIAVIWFRWTKQEREWERLESTLRAS